MTVCVDPLAEWGWVMRGRTVKSCHMFSDCGDVQELHQMAQAVGMRMSWFQNKPGRPHYDLTPSRRAMAVRLGAREVSFREAGEIWQKIGRPQGAPLRFDGGAQ